MSSFDGQVNVRAVGGPTESDLLEDKPKAKTMTKTKRFVVNEDRNIVDARNIAKSPKGYCHDGDPEDDISLRETVLQARLSDLVGHLISDFPPAGSRLSEKKITSFYPLRHSILWTLCTTIGASRVNGHEVDVSDENGLNQNLNRFKNGLLGKTSISLFVDDVGCLLEDLYGDHIKTRDMNALLLAVRTIVENVTQYACRDLWEEYENARNYDTCLGIGLPEGCGISGSENALGVDGLSKILKRSHTVLQNKSDYNQYTVKFAAYCAERFYLPGEFREVSDDVFSDCPF